MPLLVRRIVEAISPEVYVDVPSPLRLRRGKLTKEDEFSRFFDLSAGKVGDHGAILVVADADDDCPPGLRDVLLGFDCVRRSPITTAVVLANRMYENWFLAAATSLAGERGLRSDMVVPHDPESIRDPKAWLKQQHTANLGAQRHWTYSETTDQPALTSMMDIQQARCSKSFDKLYREIWLL